MQCFFLPSHVSKMHLALYIDVELSSLFKRSAVVNFRPMLCQQILDHCSEIVRLRFTVHAMLTRQTQET